MLTTDEITLTVFDELSHVLWRQRQLVDMLLYKLEVEHLLLASGRTRWLEAASNEVEGVLQLLRGEELSRAMTMHRVAHELHLPEDATLSDVIEACHAPWDEIFRDHLAVMLTSVAAVQDVAGTNRSLLLRGLRDTQAFLAGADAATSRADAYSRTGGVSHQVVGPAIFDSDV